MLRKGLAASCIEYGYCFKPMARMLKKLKLTGLLSLNLSHNYFFSEGILALATEVGALTSSTKYSI
jgi:hypothetical protein